MAYNIKSAKNLKPFKKGKGKNMDARIRAHGRPKDFDTLRKLAKRVGSEDVAIDEENYIITRIEAMLLAMSSSKHPSDRKTFLEYAYGKVKDEIDNSGTVTIEVNVKGNDGQDKG